MIDHEAEYGSALAFGSGSSGPILRHACGWVIDLEGLDLLDAVHAAESHMWHESMPRAYGGDTSGG